MQPFVETLAREFSEGLRAYLTEEQMQAVVEHNRTETDRGACQSQDFCDGNIVLHEVFLRHGMVPAAEGGMDLYGALWDQAWKLPKGRDLHVAG